MNDIILRPATITDQRKIFAWLTHSDLTSEMMGPPLFPDHPIPDWNEFNEDYTDYYFTDTDPMQGRCFIIEYDGMESGQINYNQIDLKTMSTEIDIWMAGSEYTGKGLGTLAIHMLCDYLKTELKCRSVYIAPSARNLRAVKVYQNAGFAPASAIPGYYIPDYHDALLMVKNL